jgi:hypothetical protein
MRRQFILALMAATALLLGVFAPAAASPRPAGWEWQAPTGWDWQAPTGWDWQVPTGETQTASLTIDAQGNAVMAGYNPLNPWRYGTRNVCVAEHYFGATQWPVYTSTEKWDAISPDLSLASEHTPISPCGGYTDRTRIDIFYTSDPGDDRCVIAGVDYLDGFVTNGNFYVNTGRPECHTSSINRAYWVSRSIGWILGLAVHANGNASVMSYTGWSQDNVPYPLCSDGEAIDRRYPYVYTAACGS